MADRMQYGEHPDQWIDLYLPPGRVRAVVAIVHGGYWRGAYTAELGVASAQDLVTRGFAAVNVEYRRAEDAGWPGTFEDVVAGVRAIADTVVAGFPVVLLGHSAGGHLAVWAAAHTPVAGVVSQAGILDLAETERRGLSDNAAHLLMGGTAQERPDEYRAADPMSLEPSVPVVALHSREDDVVPFEFARNWVDRVGGQARFVEVTGSHMDIITPGTAAYQASVDAVVAVLSAHSTQH